MTPMYVETLCDNNGCRRYEINKTQLWSYAELHEVCCYAKRQKWSWKRYSGIKSNLNDLGLTANVFCTSVSFGNAEAVLSAASDLNLKFIQLIMTKRFVNALVAIIWTHVVYVPMCTVKSASHLDIRRAAEAEQQTTPYCSDSDHSRPNSGTTSPSNSTEGKHVTKPDNYWLKIIPIAKS
jgi:hypothetical protein